MPISNEAAEHLQPIMDLLTGYMLASPCVRMPGGDGLLVEDVLTGYETLAAAGQVPCEAELCIRHPEFASRLTAFFHLTHQPT